MASTSMRKFHLMQYKSSEKLYEKVCSVEAMHMPLLDSVPEKITYKFDSESSMDPGASLLIRGAGCERAAAAPLGGAALVG